MSSYTAENPRRSPRLLKKRAALSSPSPLKCPTPKFSNEDEEIYEAIREFCAKKGYKFSEDIITEFNTWFDTIVSDGSRTKYEIAQAWAFYESKSIMEQKKQIDIHQGHSQVLREE
jgi:hypothetical protein